MPSDAFPAVMPTYGRSPLRPVRGEGVWLFDADGKKYLDFAGGIAVNAFGHCHPHLVEALKKQAETLWHTSNLYQSEGQEKLAGRLVATTFADSVFFTNSGVEAVECAIKMARKYHHDNGDGNRNRIICARSAFHGRSLATIAAGGQEKNMEGFGPPVEGFDHVAFGNLNEMRAAITEETAAIMVEPIQGEGGINVGTDDYLKGLRAVADEFGILLIFDEIQSGMGRTGKLFAHEWAEVEPDIMASAKGIGGGFPLGACLAVEKAARALGPGTHGTTYGGNPLAMAAGNAVMDLMEDPAFMKNVTRVATYLFDKLGHLIKAHADVFVAARGRGLMVGLKCAEGINNRDMMTALMEAGLLVAPGGDNVIRLLPPLIITEADVDAAIDILSRVATEKRGG